MSDSTNYPDRAGRLDRFFKGATLSQDFPLLKSTPVPPSLFHNLTAAVKLLFVDTLQAYYGKSFDIDSDILKTYKDEILGLPNVTPNGLFLPKSTTSASYGTVHRATVDVVEALGLSSHMSKMQLPIGLRLVHSGVDSVVAKRPYATTKVHLDIWAGEPTYAFMAFIPLLGETEKNGVEFHEPKNIPAEFLQQLDDYLGGQVLREGARTYPAKFTKGDLIIVDPFLLHNTVKESADIRLSLEFRVIPDEVVDSDIENSGITWNNYIPYSLWKDIGRNQVYVPSAKLGKLGEALELPKQGDPVGRIVDLEHTEK